MLLGNLTCERDLMSVWEESATPDGEKISEGVATLATLISLVVSVPVLSLQMKSTQPSASTVGSRFTTALLRAMRITPKASVTVTTMGRPYENQCCHISTLQRGVIPVWQPC